MDCRNESPRNWWLIQELVVVVHIASLWRVCGTDSHKVSATRVKVGRFSSSTFVRDPSVWTTPSNSSSSRRVLHTLRTSDWLAKVILAPHREA